MCPEGLIIDVKIQLGEGKLDYFCVKAQLDFFKQVTAGHPEILVVHPAAPPDPQSCWPG